MTPFDDTLFLRSSVDVLSFFNEEQLRKVTPDIERRTYQAGQTVVLRGEVTSGFYIIKKGKAAATYKTAAGTVTQPLGVGDFFGVMTLLQDMPSDAAVKAAEDGTEVITIPADSFKKLIEMQPLLRSGLLAKVLERHKKLHAQGK